MDTAGLFRLVSSVLRRILLPKAPRRFTGDFPDVRISMHESTADQVLGDLQSGVLDVGCIFASPLLPSTLTYWVTNRVRNRDPLIVVLPEHHQLAGLGWAGPYAA